MSENGSRRVVEFDIDRYVRNSKKVDLTQIDWEDIPNHPLSDGDVMCLHYMMDIETHTVIYLRDLLATRASHDPHVTAFLSCWVYEELWHGEAFSDFLRQYGLEVPAEPRLPDGSRPLPSRPARTAQVRERMGVGHQLFVLPSMLGSLLMRDFVALHMTWGAINELTTLTGYRRLAVMAGHPVLSELLERITRDESRHFFFYYRQAEIRLRRPAVARVARYLVDRFWAPVGSGVQPQRELRCMASYLFSDPRGRAAAHKADDTIRRLPGFATVGLLESWLDRFAHGGLNGDRSD
jgi:hypothetical protein